MSSATSGEAPENSRGYSGEDSNGGLSKLIGHWRGERVVLLIALLVGWVVFMRIMESMGYLAAPYSLDYLFSVSYLIVPVTLVALAEMFVLVTGRGAIDLSVGAVVNAGSVIFGYALGMWGWPTPLALAAAVVVCGFLGAVNGFLAAYLGFPALLVTLATSYAFNSIILMAGPVGSIATPPIAELNASLGGSQDIFGPVLPPIPSVVFVFLVPASVIVWVVFNRTPLGRRLYAVGLNDSSARFVGVLPKRVRFQAFVCSGALSGLAAVVLVATYAAATTNAGSNMVFPAIAVAVLGGLSFAGGSGRVGAVVMAGLLVACVHTGLLLMFSGGLGEVYYALALGLFLILAAVVNDSLLPRFAWRKFSGPGSVFKHRSRSGQT